MTIVHSFDELIQHVDRKRNEVSYNVIAELVQRADEYSPVGDINLWKRPKSAPEGYIGGQLEVTGF